MAEGDERLDARGARGGEPPGDPPALDGRALHVPGHDDPRLADAEPAEARVGEHRRLLIADPHQHAGARHRWGGDEGQEKDEPCGPAAAHRRAIVPETGAFMRGWQSRRAIA